MITRNDLNLKIDNWIENNKSEILEKWIDICKIPSIKGSAAPKAPFGIECARALKASVDLFDSEYIKADCYEEAGYGLATYGDGEKIIGLFTHSDVVPVGEDWIYTEPFNPIIKDGALIGRGSEDNKSGIIASLCATKFFADNNIKLKSKLQTFIGSDEECGMGDLINYLKEHKMPDVSIIPDADFPCSTGEKGIYHFWCQSRDSFKDIISIEGGEAFNIVLDKVYTKIKYSTELYNELECKISSSDKFTLTADGEIITLLAKGIAKHASVPAGSVNAAFITAELLSECNNISAEDRDLMFKIRDILSSSYGNTLDVYYDDINFGKTTTVNGMIKTENGKVSISFDCRYGDGYDAEKIEKNSEAVLNSKNFDITYKDNRAGFSIDKNSEVPLAFEKIYAEITGENLKSVLMSGGTYARKLDNAFSIGTYVIKKDRTTPVLKMPEGHGGPHQCDEMIDIEGFFVAVKILINYILACDEIINN